MSNQMGSKGEHAITFSGALLFKLEQSGWALMSQAEAGCLIWLQDLMTTNVHHIELSIKVHLQWDLAVQHGEDFTVEGQGD